MANQNLNNINTLIKVDFEMKCLNEVFWTVGNKDSFVLSYDTSNTYKGSLEELKTKNL